jgi:hypothetical protein
MKPQVKFVLAASLAALTVAGCVAPQDRPREVMTRSGVQEDTYIPQSGTAPYGRVDPHRSDSPRGPATPE